MTTQKLKDLEVALSAKYLEREEVIHGILIAIMAKMNVLLVGEPGTAKSDLVRDIGRAFDGSHFFQWLLTEYTVPEELFGALSLAELEKGKYVRNPAGKMPEAHVAFLDEVFKANSSILNTLLTAINERLFYNNCQPTPMPLMSVIGASNEYADAEENLAALDDRFQVRFKVEDVKESDSFLSILKNSTAPAPALPQIPLADLNTLQASVDSVAVTDAIMELLEKIRIELAEEGITTSTRRWVQSLRVVRAEAAYNDRMNVCREDLGILKHVLWKNPEDARTVKSIIAKHVVDHFASAVKEIQKTIKGIVTRTGGDENDLMEGIKKLKALETEARELKVSHPDKEKDVDSLLAEFEAAQNEIAKKLFA